MTYSFQKDPKTISSKGQYGNLTEGSVYKWFGDKLWWCVSLDKIGLTKQCYIERALQHYRLSNCFVNMS